MIITGKKFSKPDLSRVINGDTELAAPETAPEKVRLDHLLVEQHPEYNRSSLQTFVKSGYVTVDGEVVTKPNTKFLPEAKIELRLPKTERSLPKIPVIYEDQNILVLDKPQGLLSMAKGEYCAEPTLEDYGLLVHRLDRDTSGVVILAKNPETQKMLRKQFQDRKAHKVYNAIVVGSPKLPEAMIDLPIARNLKRPTTFQVNQNGKPSQTYYKVLKQVQTNTGTYSLLELKPTTGRTHQLRVHLKYLSIPILGDPVYGTEKIPRDFRPRLYLHARELEITIPDPENPCQKIRQTFISPLPSEFSEIFHDKNQRDKSPHNESPNRTSDEPHQNKIEP